MDHYFKEAIDLHNSILRDGEMLNALRDSVNDIVSCFERGNKLLIAGNGGSAADAQHFAAEMVGRYKKERKAYPALALTVDSSIITAISNDYSFDTIFSRQIEAFGKGGDILIVISTSGNSINLIEASKKAKQMDLQSIGFLGKGGGALKNECDRPLIVPSDNIPRIQEAHEMFFHIICEEVEKKLTVNVKKNENAFHNVLS